MDTGSFDFAAGWRALVDYQNRRGGISGRRVIPAFWTLQSTSAQSFAAQEQAACAAWTQDRHVFAAMTFVYSDNILRCLGNANVPLISLDTIATTSTTLVHRRYPLYIEPIALSLDRGATTMVDRLQAMGYFATTEKLGLVSLDASRFHESVRSGLMPALQQHGLSLQDAVYLHYPGSLADYGQVASDASNAVLRFKTEGIDHVLFLDWGGVAGTFFPAAAQRADYHPRYGLTSQSGPQTVAGTLGSEAKAQFHGALGVGWSPAFDVAPSSGGPDARNSTARKCLAIMRDAGVGASGAVGVADAQMICDAMWSFAAALHRAAVINVQTFSANVNRLGTTYRPASTWSTYLDATHHDGVGSVANLRFVDSCSCFRYAGPATAIE